MIFKSFDDIGNSGTFLTDSHINAVKLFGSLSSFEIFPLVQNSIDGNSSFSSLPISDNEFSLSSAYWYETVDCLESCLHGLVD